MKTWNPPHESIDIVMRGGGSRLGEMLHCYQQPSQFSESSKTILIVSMAALPNVTVTQDDGGREPRGQHEVLTLHNVGSGVGFGGIREGSSNGTPSSVAGHGSPRPVTSIAVLIRPRRPMTSSPNATSD